MTILQVLINSGMTERQARIALARSFQPVEELQRKAKKARSRSVPCREVMDLTLGKGRLITKELAKKLKERERNRG